MSWELGEPLSGAEWGGCLSTVELQHFLTTPSASKTGLQCLLLGTGAGIRECLLSHTLPPSVPRGAWLHACPSQVAPRLLTFLPTYGDQRRVSGSQLNDPFPFWLPYRVPEMDSGLENKP